MKKLNIKMNKKMRKAADGGNLALIALAIGVIIIIGMYVFTQVIGNSTSTKSKEITTAMSNTGTIDAIKKPS